MKIIATENACAPLGHYSQAVVQGDTIYCSMLLGIQPGGDGLAVGSLEEQTNAILDNLEEVLLAGSSNLQQVLKVTIYLVDMQDFATVNAIYAKRFGEHRPARAVLAVSALPKGFEVAFDAIACAAVSV